MADAAARVRVRDLDELADGPHAVAGHAGGDALRHRRQPAADDQAAVVVARDVALDDDVPRAALAQRLREGRPHVGFVAQVQGDAPAVVAVQRLDHARVAEAPGGGDGLVLGRHHLRARHGHPGGVQKSVRELLVGRDVHGDAARPAGHRCPDPLLVDTLAQLHEAVPVQPDVGDVPARRLVQERLRGRAEGEPLREADQVLQLRDGVEGVVRVPGRDEVVDEADGQASGLDPDLLLAVLEDDVVAAVVAGAARLAVADVRAGEVLELQRQVLGHVAGPGAVAQPGDEAAAPAERAGVVLQGGDQRHQRVHEPRDPVGRPLLEHAQVHDLADHGFAGPVVGAAHDARIHDLQGWRGAGARVRGAGRLRRGGCVGRVGRRGPGLSRPLPGSWIRLRHLVPPREPSDPECTRRRSLRVMPVPLSIAQEGPRFTRLRSRDG